jgi:leader peptidase (prepilin peptidase)/N-methyltransferase
MPGTPLAPFYIPTLVFSFILGINIGSFLNVVIWRLPRGGSLTTPTWSYCPKCEHQLSTLDLFPVFSFLFLGAKCRYCKAPISWRYPGIELLTGLLFVGVAYCYGASWETVFYCIATAIWVSVFFIDLEHFVIPDGLNILLVLVGISHNIVAIATGEKLQELMFFGVFVPTSIIGLIEYSAIIYGIGLFSYMYLVGYGAKRGIFHSGFTYVKENVMDWVYLCVYYLSVITPPLQRFVEKPEPLVGATQEEIEGDEEAGGMGGGDGKLAAGIGATLPFVFMQVTGAVGFSATVSLGVFSLFIALISGLAYGLVVKMRERKNFGTHTAIPFGPHMVLGAYIALLLGKQILTWYFSTMSIPSTPGGVPTTGG